MKKIISIMMVLALALTVSTVAFAAEPTKAGNDAQTGPQVNEQTTRAITNYSTGTIAGGGSNYVTVLSTNPWVTEQWTIGRISGTSGKIDIEVRNGLGVVLGSKSFSSDGDGTLSVTVPWDSGTCSVRVYNNNSYAGSWRISIAT